MELLARSAGLLLPRMRVAPAASNGEALLRPMQQQQQREPLQPMGTRGLRNFPIQVLCRNQNFLRKVSGKGVEIEKEWTLGISLEPSEVKALRDRNGDLSAAFGEFFRHELYIHQLHIPVWRHGLIGRPEPMRVRKLLANKSELKKMEAFLTQPDAQLIPMRIETGKTGWIKVVMAQCFRRSKVDNRKRDDERDIKRQLRDY